MARIVAEKSESSFSQVIHSAGVRRFGEAQGPRSEYMEVLVSALNEDCIPARIVLIADVEPVNRPEWTCTPGDEAYVVVPRDKREVALELAQ
jgi:hypothetical protein